MPILDPTTNLSSELLGDDYPYWWCDDDGRVHWFRTPEDAIEALPAERRTVDPISVLSLFSFQYICLDRTMVQGVRHLPWLSTLWGTGELQFLPAPHHDQRQMPIEEVAASFLERLEAEILRYVRSYERAYLLLSGGMDSRVMAAVVARLEARGEFDATVEAVTWGEANSRDVVYAERLADHYGWQWHWAELDEARYWANFQFGAVALGAEVDPKHLHRMDWFREAEPNSVVLAASYGDSVGRAEFSSIHLNDLPPLVPSDRNRLLRPEVREWAWPGLEEDILAPRQRHGTRGELGWLEIERQAHYMRRMLNHAMCVINRWTHVEQVFVAPDVYGFMWGLDPSLRTDEVYVRMLRQVDPTMLEVAWARTGARYDTGEGSDDLAKSFHRYGLWLRRDHADDIGELIFGDPTVERLRLFDMDQLRWMYDEWTRERPADNTSLSTQMSSIASLSILARRFEISAPRFDHPSEPAMARWIAARVRRSGARVSQKVRRLSRPLRMRLSGA